MINKIYRLSKDLLIETSDLNRDLRNRVLSFSKESIIFFLSVDEMYYSENSYGYVERLNINSFCEGKLFILNVERSIFYSQSLGKGEIVSRGPLFCININERNSHYKCRLDLLLENYNEEIV
tara:strand:+ start:165 stop:530 length:366 start_codon:yes stop_codon:yes gene_type:complete